MSNIIKKEADTALEEKDRRFKETWLPRLTLLLSVISIIFTSLILINNEVGSISTAIARFRKDGGVQKIINWGNIFTAVVAFLFIAWKTPKFFSIQNATKFKSLAELELEGDDLQVHLGNIENRVEKLVNQYRFHMILFAFSFVLLYGVILSAGGYDRTHISFLPIATNLLNFLGAVFVYLGFSVLHNKTLEAERFPTSATDSLDKNKPHYLNYNSSLYWGLPVLVLISYTSVFIVRALAYQAQQPYWEAQSAEAAKAFGLSVEHFLNRFDLIAGFANGLAMSLLFGKYVSIEQSLSKTKSFKNVFENIFYPFSRKPYKAIVSFGIIFVLPIYALAQPLFGSLRIEAFGDPHRLQTIVYVVCLLGKIVFFHLTYLLISKNLLHLYLYGMVAEIGNFKELEACFVTDKKEIGAGVSATALLSEQALAEDWNRPEEDEAWSHLQKVP
jgi:large-conductance mechanosensitive channel